MVSLETLYTLIAIIFPIYVTLWIFSQKNKRKQFNSLLEKVGHISDSMIGSMKDIKSNTKDIKANQNDIFDLQATQTEHGLDIRELKTKIGNP